MKFSYARETNALGQTLLRPILPITLTHNERSVRAQGLLDTGADVNILPYHLGLQLGAIWERQPLLPPISGNLADDEARALFLYVTVAALEPISMGFAWTSNEKAPLLLGQINFLSEFDVCFYGSEAVFEIHRRRPTP